MKFVVENREELIQAFVAKTGVQPDEAVLCEQRMQDGTVKLWVRQKGEIEKKIDQKNLGATIFLITSRGSLCVDEGFFTDENTAKFRVELLTKLNVESCRVVALKKNFHGEPENDAC